MQHFWYFKIDFTSVYIKDHKRAGSIHQEKCAITLPINQPKNGRKGKKRDWNKVKMNKDTDITLVQTSYMICLFQINDCILYVMYT